MARRVKGEGGLYQAKDKTWVYQYWQDGKRKTKRFRRKSDAVAFIKAMSDGIPQTELPMPSAQAVESVPQNDGRETARNAVETAQGTAEMNGSDQREATVTPQVEATANAGQTGAAHSRVVQPTMLPRMTPGQMQMMGVAEVITLGDWLDRWLEVYAKPTVKLSTYTSYEMYIRRHIKPNIGNLYLSSIRVDDLQAFFNERGTGGNLVTGEGLSPKTLTNMRNMLHMSLDQAVRNRLMFDNIVEAVRLPRMVKKEMRVLNREEQDRLITAARLMPEPAAFGIIFDLFTGIRLGELCGLRWENVHMELKQFLVCETRNRLPNFNDAIRTSTSVKTEMNTKTANSRRVVYLMDSLCQDFAQYKAIQDSLATQYPGYNRDGYVFCQENGHPYEPRTYQDLFKRCVRQAGIKDANFHSLRHTFATRSLEEGMDIVTLSRLLGHASPSITMDKYGHSLDEQKRNSMEKLGSLYKGASARFSRPER